MIQRTHACLLARSNPHVHVVQSIKFGEFPSSGCSTCARFFWETWLISCLCLFAFYSICQGTIEQRPSEYSHEPTTINPSPVAFWLLSSWSHSWCYQYPELDRFMSMINDVADSQSVGHASTSHD